MSILGEAPEALATDDRSSPRVGRLLAPRANQPLAIQQDPRGRTLARRASKSVLSRSSRSCHGRINRHRVHRPVGSLARRELGNPGAPARPVWGACIAAFLERCRFTDLPTDSDGRSRCVRIPGLRRRRHGHEFPQGLVSLTGGCNPGVARGGAHTSELADDRSVRMTVPFAQQEVSDALHTHEHRLRRGRSDPA
jgi:hypothetical protein